MPKESDWVKVRIKQDFDGITAKFKKGDEHELLRDHVKTYGSDKVEPIESANFETAVAKPKRTKRQTMTTENTTTENTPV